jgi:hypothetical protein
VSPFDFADVPVIDGVNHPAGVRPGPECTLTKVSSPVAFA